MEINSKNTHYGSAQHQKSLQRKSKETKQSVAINGKNKHYGHQLDFEKRINRA